MIYGSECRAIDRKMEQKMSVNKEKKNFRTSSRWLGRILRRKVETEIG